MIIFTTPQEYLAYYYNRYGYHFRVQHWSKVPQPWGNFKDKEYLDYIKDNGYVNHREIFPDEIVLDLDLHSDNVSDEMKREKTRKVGDLLLERINEYQYSYWYSGGNGYHIHLFFPELMDYSKSHRQLLKQLFVKDIGIGLLRVPEGDAHICRGNPSLIQLEWEKHRKGGKKSLITFRKQTQPNKLPAHLLTSFEEKKHEYSNKKLFQLSPGTPKAIQLLEKEDFANLQDGRTRGLFVLACYYANFMGRDELEKKLIDWNRNSLRGYLKLNQIRATARSVTNKKKDQKVPLFPFRYLENLMEELGIEVDYSDMQIK